MSRPHPYLLEAHRWARDRGFDDGRARRTPVLLEAADFAETGVVRHVGFYDWRAGHSVLTPCKRGSSGRPFYGLVLPAGADPSYLPGWEGRER